MALKKTERIWHNGKMIPWDRRKFTCCPTS